MSLVITSNQFVENGGDYHSAFSYRNHLTGTTRIPANSESDHHARPEFEELG